MEGWREQKQRGREKNTGKQKGTLAAKLSLNIISLSLVHYLFNKFLRAELVVHGQEVTHYAFYNNASRGYWQGTGQHAKRWMKKRIEKEGSRGRYLEVEGEKNYKRQKSRGWRCRQAARKERRCKLSLRQKTQLHIFKVARHTLHTFLSAGRNPLYITVMTGVIISAKVNGVPPLVHSTKGF